MLLSNSVPESLASTIRHEKEILDKSIGKEEITLSLLVDYGVIYIEKSREYLLGKKNRGREMDQMNRLSCRTLTYPHASHIQRRE